jgi:hypothetical protein
MCAELQWYAVYMVILSRGGGGVSAGCPVGHISHNELSVYGCESFFDNTHCCTNTL